ncbi:MAG: hypothetical protein WCI11_19315 [Candidatus Methylumidiphilus sp.]
MIIADTGFWVPLSNPKDQHHSLALRKFAELKEPLISTWPVMTEVCHLLLKRQGIEAQLTFPASSGLPEYREARASETAFPSWSLGTSQ